MSCRAFYWRIKNLMQKLYNLQTKQDLANSLRVPLKYLTHKIYIQNSYTEFEIPKKNGEMRKISAPNNELKQLQRKLLKALYFRKKQIQEEYNKSKNLPLDRVNNISHAFEQGSGSRKKISKGIITNANIHVNKKFVLNIDLKDFFDSFHFGRVQGFFEKNKNFLISHDISIMLANLVCHNGSLPQGAPTSPIITNLITHIMDMKILKICKKYKLDYTRYADDLTFSTNKKDFLDYKNDFLKEITTQIKKSGFMINDKKTRLQYKSARQEVTGLVVNKKINVKREYYKTIRAMANSLYKNGTFIIGIDNKDEKIEGNINQLEGKFAFIDYIERFNNIKSNNTKPWSAKEKDYQKFIFYKYFIATKKPLIITEGKTDIKYIKAALKNLYKDYPNLVEKVDDKFDFKSAFLKRTKRLEYFLNLPIDGADAMANFYSSTFVKLEKIFKEKYKITPKNALIYLFDNETMKDKPLRKFINSLKVNDKEEIKKEMRTKFFYELEQNKYLVACNLIDSEKKCELKDNKNKKCEKCELKCKFEREIEDLFKEFPKLKGKTFDKNAKPNDEKYYSKNELANYILKRYNEIDFTNFRPLLDIISKIVN